ncbi:MAG: hypothetical protein ACFB2W_06555 [Leptolyngbyaceae cyanobacterium]
MKRSRAHAVADPDRSARSQQSYTWVQTVSGMTALAVGLQAAAVGEASITPAVEPSTANLKDSVFTDGPVLADTNIEATVVAPVKPDIVQPRFSQWGAQVQGLITNAAKSPIGSPVVNYLEAHQRELHQRSNAVESQLLELQLLLSLQPYGTSFADQLLHEDTVYQTKLRRLKVLEADLHTAFQQADTTMFDQLRNRVQQTERELQQQAQRQLQQHISQAQTRSTLSLWREPMYRESLRWLMEHTHERHSLTVRQQTLASTLVALAPED